MIVFYKFKYQINIIILLYIRRRISKSNKTIETYEETVCKIEVTKKAKLALFAGFETEVRNGIEVPKDSILFLWLNVAKSIL